MVQNKGIVVVDFSGTLVKPFVAEEANLNRYKVLGLTPPSEQDRKRHHGTKEHYDPLRARIGEIYGIRSDLMFRFLQSHGFEIELNGTEYETMMMTDRFRDEAFKIAKERGLNIFSDGMIDALQTVQRRGYKLAIVSGMRLDIIAGLLGITLCPLRFDFIYGQDPILSRDDNKLLTQELAKQGTIEYIIGDKMADLEPATMVGAKSIFFKGGHPTGGEEQFADHTVARAKELEDIIK